MSIERTLGRISLRMASKLDLTELLSEITRSLVQDLDAALARIWLVRPGDLCSTCRMAPRCRDRTLCLHLVASAGLAERLDGTHQRVPLGTLKIGWIGESHQAVLTNDLVGDSRILDKDWVQRERLRAFAGYPLVFADELLGVLAMFARRELLGDELDRLGVFAAQAAVAIKNAQLFDEVSQLSRRLEAENAYLKEELRTELRPGIVGKSRAIREVLASIERVAPTQSTVLLLGETGTGKELFANALHDLSPRRGAAFVKVNCAAIAPALIESELFGHEKGAFTGALQRRAGRFELAHRGTLFLDEVAELPLEAQAKLLRVLQEREFERVGGARTLPVDVRVICATNRNLETEVAERRFRQDLFYRLNVFPIWVPPLRERAEDIRILVEHFLDRFATRAGRKFAGIEGKTLKRLEAYSWPGNVRELQNVIERSVILCDGNEFSVDERCLGAPSTPADTNAGSLPEQLGARERQLIEATLAQTGGKVFGPLGAAVKLGMPPTTLSSKIKALKIDIRRFKPL
ncbi:MAG TPA: sigma 54-interacting transcriptional regulator [Myxococcaceae bacterium]|nr:sigma 54-interacting transcriptional regulator [Myxococcaceae bacterium]